MLPWFMSHHFWILPIFWKNCDFGGVALVVEFLSTSQYMSEYKCVKMKNVFCWIQIITIRISPFTQVELLVNLSFHFVLYA
jgi:hypothetical protein